jgi:hypothetical protein
MKEWQFDPSARAQAEGKPQIYAGESKGWFEVMWNGGD